MKLTWNDCLKIGVSIFGLYLCINLWPGAVALVKALLGASAPLILGCAIAYVVNILMRFFENHWPTTGKFSTAALKFRRPVSLLLAFASVAALVVLIVALIVPQLISCVQLLLSEIPGAMTKAVAFVNSLNIVPQDLLAPLLKVDWQSKLLGILSTLTSGVTNVMGAVISTVSSVFSALVTGLLALIFSIYLLLERETLRGQFGKLLRRFLPTKWQGRVSYVLHTVDDCFQAENLQQIVDKAIEVGGKLTIFPIGYIQIAPQNHGITVQ